LQAPPIAGAKRRLLAVACKRLFGTHQDLGPWEMVPDPNGTALSILLPSTSIFSRLVAWYCPEGMRFWPSLDGPRLAPIRTLANARRTPRAGEGLQQRLLGRGCRKQERWPKRVDSLE